MSQTPHPHPNPDDGLAAFRRPDPGALLSSQSGLPQTHPHSLDLKKPLLGSCCKGSLAPAHLNSGIPSTHHAPLGLGDPYLVLREYPAVISVGKLIPIHSVGRLAALREQPVIHMAASVIDVMVAFCAIHCRGLFAFVFPEVTT